ncbi:copper resistance CopC family protein [Catelliglobosispora koreensis]|uniref:copper resistance CopC family protein n=1 Tax=Catelliglobosispora koreensis TaxID=129052 RepID=UPI0003A1EA0A|nr:copper resistance CopC family protein [Catelliglobosispora koreensis]
MRKTAAFGLALSVAILGFPAPAFAHGQLAYSVPANQTTVSTTPREIALYFTEAPAQSATFTVTSPDGQQLLSGWSHGQPSPLPTPAQELNLVDGKWEPVFYRTGFPALLTVTHWPVQGLYTVSYQSVASDGDKVQGTIRFDYQGPMTTAPPAPAASSPHASSSSFPWWFVGVAAILLIGALACFAPRHRRKKAD